MSNRVQEFLSRIPMMTLGILILNFGVHLLMFLTSASLNKFAISPALVLFRGEYYRIVTCAFLHSGILHIAMNMSSLLQLGVLLEAQFGSLQFLFLSAWSVLLIGSFYCALEWLYAIAIQDARPLFSSAVGYSGVLFTYAVLEAFHTTETTRSFFGMFNVPARIMPFLLLVAIQIVLPGISLMGHLSGVIVGLLVLSGFLQFLLPSVEFIEGLESLPVMQGLVRRSGYIKSTGRPLVSSRFYIFGEGSTCSVFYSGICCVCKQIHNVVVTILHVFGCPPERLSAFISSIFAPLIRVFSGPPQPSPPPMATSPGIVLGGTTTTRGPNPNSRSANPASSADQSVSKAEEGEAGGGKEGSSDRNGYVRLGSHSGYRPLQTEPPPEDSSLPPTTTVIL